MMCEPGERDLAHAAARAVAAARAQGLEGEALLEAATAEVAALWSHLDPATLRAAVVRQLAADAAPGSA